MSDGSKASAGDAGACSGVRATAATEGDATSKSQHGSPDDIAFVDETRTSPGARPVPSSGA